MTYCEKLNYIEKYLYITVYNYSATQWTVNLPFCQQQAVWYIPINQLCSNDSFFLYPRGLWGKYIFLLLIIFHSCTGLYAGLISFGCQSEKIKTVNGIAALIIDKMWRYVQFCTFFKNPLHCEIPALTVEWQCLYSPLSTCNCYYGYFTRMYLICGFVTICHIKTTKNFSELFYQSVLYITAACCGLVGRMFLKNL